MTKKMCVGTLCVLFLVVPNIAAQRQTDAAANRQGAVLSLQEAIDTLSRGVASSAEFHWDPFLQTGTFYRSGHYGCFRLGERGETAYSLIDGYLLVSMPSPYMENGSIKFPHTFVSLIKNAIDEEAKRDLKLFRVAAIVIDPGHGGKDTGAIYTHTLNGSKRLLREKDITLEVSLSLRNSLAARYPDKQILMTRDADKTLQLKDRTDLANAIQVEEHEAIIFVSIHCNSEMSPEVRKTPASGYEIWFLPPETSRDVLDEGKYGGNKELHRIFNTLKEEEYSFESRLLGECILKHLDRTIKPHSPSRGIKEEEWYVVKRSYMPAVLVELGFITNASDATLLTDKAFLSKYNEALHKGIADFILLFEQPGGFNVIQ